MRPRGVLWRHPDFLKLWAGQSVSLMGTAVTMLALPTAAILGLHAGAFDVGLLAAVQRLPFPLLALFAGVWVDRVRRRPLMIAADVGRALVVVSVPLAAFSGHLTLAQLYVVAALLGTLSVVFDVGYLAYLPSLVDQSQLMEGNTKLQLSYSMSGLAGPSVAGVLIQAFGAARSMLADAASYLASVVALLSIRRHEENPRGEARSDMRAELREGLRLVFRHEILRSQLLLLTAGSMGFYLALPMLLIFMYSDLHLSPLAVGLLSALEGVGQIGGALSAARWVRLLGLGHVIAGMQALASVTIAALPLALVLPPVPTLAVVLTVLGVSSVVHDVNQVSLRQGLTPAHLQGRMNATFRAFFWGAWPVASLLGGLLGSTWGHAQTLMLGGGLAMLASLAIVGTPLWRIREHPKAPAGMGVTAHALAEAATTGVAPGLTETPPGQAL